MKERKKKNKQTNKQKQRHKKQKKTIIKYCGRGLQIKVIKNE